jgi:hypothetical protein
MDQLPTYSVISLSPVVTLGYVVVQLVEALHFKKEGRRFDSADLYVTVELIQEYERGTGARLTINK